MFVFKHCCVLFAFALLFSCSELKQPLPANQDPKVSVHPAAWSDTTDITSTDFHRAFIRTNQWNLANCQQCHGFDYTGGIAEISCIPCHQQTPEDCVVCHGGVEDLSGAPPLDLDDNTDASSLGVGAHTVHLNGAEYSNGFTCQQCHLVPASYADQGHADSELPAELTFGGLATLNGALPNWVRNSATCADSYCHGNWSLAKSESNNQFMYASESIEGNNATPTWTDATTVTCGTCHDLPPQGHTAAGLNTCVGCHAAVIDADGNIIDKSKHVNGMVNVLGQEFPMF